MDKNDISALWDELTPKLYGYLVNTLRDRALAEDILQTSWLKAVENLPSFKSRGIFKDSFSAWIFAIARNECKQHWRKSGREIPFDSSTHDVADTSDKTEISILVDQVLSKLPETDREILRLRYIADMPMRELAKVLGLNQIAARVRLHRAKAEARKILMRR